MIADDFIGEFWWKEFSAVILYEFLVLFHNSQSIRFIAKQFKSKLAQLDRKVVSIILLLINFIN